MSRCTFRLWLVMIAIFTGVSTARAEIPCWILTSNTAPQPGPVQPKKPSGEKNCLQGKLEKRGEDFYCIAELSKEVRSKGSIRRLEYFTDSQCMLPIPGADKARERDLEFQRMLRTINRIHRREVIRTKVNTSKLKPQESVGGIDPNHGATDPGTAGSKPSKIETKPKHSVPSN